MSTKLSVHLDRLQKSGAGCPVAAAMVAGFRYPHKISADPAFELQ
jgi:hypothetical protein